MPPMQTAPVTHSQTAPAEPRRLPTPAELRELVERNARELAETREFIARLKREIADSEGRPTQG